VATSRMTPSSSSTPLSWWSAQAVHCHAT
jgi:hypothetical protein